MILFGFIDFWVKLCLLAGIPRNAPFEGLRPARARGFPLLSKSGYDPPSSPRARKGFPSPSPTIRPRSGFAPRAQGVSSDSRSYSQSWKLRPARARGFPALPAQYGRLRASPRARKGFPHADLIAGIENRFAPRAQGVSPGFRPQLSKAVLVQTRVIPRFRCVSRGSQVSLVYAA